jgi:hypothetical protein
LPQRQQQQNMTRAAQPPPANTHANTPTRRVRCVCVLRAAQKQRSRQKHDFFRRTQRGQPVMKYRVDKILGALQREQGMQQQQRQR